MDAKVREKARKVARKAGVEAFNHALHSVGSTTGVDAFGVAIDAFEAALKAAGYVMVPREITDEMFDAPGANCASLYLMVHLAACQAESHEHNMQCCREIWSAMINAATNPAP